MYKIGILDKDEEYLWRLVGFLKERHKDSFEINVADGGFGLDAVDVEKVHYDALFLGDEAGRSLKVPKDTLIGYLTKKETDDEQHISKKQSLEGVYRQMIKLCETPKKAEKAAKLLEAATSDEFVMHMISENVKSKEAKDANRFLTEIKKLCDTLMASIVEEKNEDDGCGSTEEFESLQKNAKDSLEVKLRTKTPDSEEFVPYIVRKRTGEKVLINRNLFKLGKDVSYVDYCVKDNPAVSRNHADIVRKPDGFYLIDKGSLNHTFVDGRKLETGEYRKLEDRCLMQLADEVFEVRLK